jgi:sugar phosphate isomerase/epimerase
MAGREEALVLAWKARLGLSAHVKGKTVEETAAVARRLGVRYLEIVAERFWDLPDGGGEAQWQTLRELLASYGLRPIVHASYMEINLASLNRYLREAAVRQTLRCLELASFLEADHLVVHPGNLNRNYPPSFLPEARACLHESLRTLVAQASAAGMVVALENGWNGEDHPIITNGEEHATFIEEVGSPALKALFDLGHAHTFGGNLTTYLDRLQPYLASIHLHDNGGGGDEHLALGRGTVGSKTIQRCFDAGVPVILEMNSLDDINVSMAYLEAHLFAC